MPQSPFQRAQNEGLVGEQDKGSSTGGKKKRYRGKSKSKPTTKARTYKQTVKDRYAHAREDAQLLGLIPTTPEEALKPERVSSSVQSSQPMPELIAQAIRKGWAVPDNIKPELVDELIALISSSESEKVKVAAFNALRMADESQYERDNPGAVASKVKSSNNTTIGSINIQNNMQAAALIREMVNRGELGNLEELRASDKSSASSDSGQQREMETGTTFESDQQRTSESMENTE